MILTEAKKARDEYILQVTREHPTWSAHQVAEEVRRVYGECSHTHVINVWKRHGVK